MDSETDSEGSDIENAMSKDFCIEVSVDDQLATSNLARQQEPSGQFRQKVNVCDELSPDLISFIANYENATSKLSGQLRQRPTLPHGVDPGSLDEGKKLPKKFCAFIDCCWHGEKEGELIKHVINEHASAFQDMDDWDGSLIYHTEESSHIREKRRYALYCAAVVRKEQSQVPCVGIDIDRRCRSTYLDQLSDENVFAPICLMCARVLPYEGNDTACEIFQVPLWQNDKLLNMTHEQAEKCMGFDKFLENHGKPKLHGKKGISTGVDMRDHQEQFEGWTLKAPYPTPLKVLCCPIDVQCEEKHLHEDGVDLCSKCTAYVCRDCHHQAAKLHRLPRYGLCNDLWIGHINEYIYANKVTYIEMLCACPVHPAVLCYQLHREHPTKHNPRCQTRARQQPVHFAEATTRAWGNITGFMCAWEDILNELSKMDEVELPHSPEKLMQIISVFVYAKRSTTGEKNADRVLTVEEMAEMRQIMATSVRREVVIELIMMGVRSRHPAWTCVTDEGKVH